MTKYRNGIYIWFAIDQNIDKSKLKTWLKNNNSELTGDIWKSPYTIWAWESIMFPDEETYLHFKLVWE